MNRLWVRLSLLYASVMIIVVLLILVPVIIFGGAGPEITPEEAAASQLTAEQFNAILVLQDAGLLREFARSVFSIQLAAITILTITIGILASIWMSYRMTRPLMALEDAAHKVGQHDLSYRVTVSGTAELVALANSFNSMAAELESAEKRRQNLLADVSHELRTPLTVLQGNLRAALDQVTRLDPPQIAKLYDHTRQLNHLINDLHDLAQAEANRLTLNRGAVDLNRLVMQAGELFTPLAEDDGLKIVVETPADAVTIQGDRARLMQVLQNLISNALRYAKSTITLTVRPGAEGVQLLVADDGVGIDPEHVAHIFDRFYRADSSRARQTGGTGLGLAIVKSLVEAHGGTIEVGSQRHHGTQMILALPLDHPV